MINLQIENLRASAAPLYHLAPEQEFPRPAYLELWDDGTVRAHYLGAPRLAPPVRGSRKLRFHVPPAVNGPALADYLEGDNGRNLLEEILAEYIAEPNLDECDYLTHAFTKAFDRLGDVLRGFDQIDVNPARNGDRP